MASKECDKCGEMVDEAKAFCPGCGHAFVEEEKRQEASKFDKLDNTVQFGQTMYNLMLSDMGLNISQPPNAPEKRVEVLAPVSSLPEKDADVPTPAPIPEEKRVEVLQPVSAATSVKPSEKKFETPKPKGGVLRYILVSLLVILVFLAMVGLSGLYFYRMRFG